jgi:hypothetical protein
VPKSAVQQRGSETYPADPRRHAVMWARGWSRLRDRLVSGPRDRGDVPGWVLVTIMTAGLVVALWALAGPKLGDLFTQAMDGVSGP